MVQLKCYGLAVRFLILQVEIYYCRYLSDMLTVFPIHLVVD